MKISVVITTFNRGHLIGEAIESALTIPTDYLHEIIVVDDGSTDSTNSVADKFHGRIRYYKKENSGKASAINYIRDAITGDAVYILDDDDYLEPASLIDAAKTLASDPRLDIVVGQYRSFRDSDSGRVFGDAKPARLDTSRLHFDLLLGSFIPLNSTLTRREHFLATGPFDERLIRSQDYEFFLRLTRGARAGFINRTMFYAREHQGVRGSAKVNVSADRVWDLWRKFDKIVGEDLRQRLSLESFCPPELLDQEESDRRRLSLLYRGLVMFTKDLPDHAINDLDEARSTQAPISNEARRIEARILTSFGNVPSLISALKDRSNRKAIAHILSDESLAKSSIGLCRLLIWRLKRSLRDGDISTSFSISSALALMPLSSTIAATRSKEAIQDYFWTDT